MGLGGSDPVSGEFTVKVGSFMRAGEQAYG